MARSGLSDPDRGPRHGNRKEQAVARGFHDPAAMFLDFGKGIRTGGPTSSGAWRHDLRAAPGQCSGDQRSRTGATVPATGFTIPRNQVHLVLLPGAVKLVVSRRPVGKVGETHCVFPGLSIGDRACAVRRGSAQPTVHKFTAPARHGVRRPAPSPPLIGRGKPRPVFAS